MRVVLDTTTLISSFISRDSYPYKAVNLWFQKEYTLVTSHWQIEELRGVSQRPHIKTLITEHEVGRLINLLRKKAIVLKDLPDTAHSADPDDNPILSAAIAAQAQYIVSGDKKHLLSLKSVRGISFHHYCA
ncbi:MAG: putative toxin-antitoxin system toxin component, PIN family [Trueperaceae bacterium]